MQDSSYREFFQETSGISSVLLLLSQQTEAGIFSRVTMTSMTAAWYTPITPIESVLLGLLLLQVFIMRYYLILPLDITKLINDGTLISTSVKKKRSVVSCSPEKHQLSETMFTVIRRLDKHDCVLHTLCELQRQFVSGNQLKLPKETKATLSALNRLGKQRMKAETQTSNNTMADRPVLSVFEEAVLTGGDVNENYEHYNSKTLNNKNSSSLKCQQRYFLCPLTEQDIKDSIQSLWLASEI